LLGRLATMHQAFIYSCRQAKSLRREANDAAVATTDEQIPPIPPLPSIGGGSTQWSTRDW
jgi:hypothetical protein